MHETIQKQAARIEQLEAALRDGGAAVERLAFQMQPPNEWTPLFVQLGQSIARAALEGK